MAKKYEVKASVILQKGFCGAGHKVGDEYTVGSTTPGGVCLAAFNALYSAVRVLQYGGTFPWSEDPDTAQVACPDAANPVVFELRRIRT